MQVKISSSLGHLETVKIKSENVSRIQHLVLLLVKPANLKQLVACGKAEFEYTFYYKVKQASQSHGE